ncbi:MAG: peroxidase family protein, partial [Hyphomicrobium sp.]
GVTQTWGTADVPFRRDVAASFDGYVTPEAAGSANAFYGDKTFAADVSPHVPGLQNGTTVGQVYVTSLDNVADDGDANTADILTASGLYVHQADVVDYTPRMISQTVTTANQTFLLDGQNHLVHWHEDLFADNGAFKIWADAAGVATGPGIPAAGLLVNVLGTALQDGQDIYVANGSGGTIGGVLHYGPGLTPPVAVWSSALYGSADYHTLVLTSGVTVADLAEGQVIVTDYGLLAGAGHVDYQHPTAEVFIGSENPGVAPSNSWFAIFGQFFDHGLDLIGKGGQGTTIKIALADDDPLYGVIGPDGQPTTSITISRATVAGADTNGDPNYINHTSPFIDQSQTYGSSDQITELLRKWVSTDGGATYHAGLELFDGASLEQTWTRKWPDGSTTEVRDTLPTLSELRDHVLDTGRAEITWEDVADFRNRNDAGQIDAGNSGHALILDMQMRFDTAHLDSTQAVGGSTVNDLVDAAVITLNNSLGSPDLTFQRSASGGLELIVKNGAGGTHMPNGVYTGASALAPWVDLSNFSIMSPPASPYVTTPLIADAVGQILMAGVGDHYIAGDGRVNENFGLTSIHHVFHEEHNYQVQNLITSIYAQDDAEVAGQISGGVSLGDIAHDNLHKWQVNTGVLDASGNYVNGYGSVAWDADKMFNATKLIVEMEYQHAAVDQYARTITPRIQEFVGYSSGADPTISLEYSQVAFRFGHSTIRETLNTIDPDGWFSGAVTKYALEAAFLNPAAFAEHGPAAVTLGLSQQQMNEVDEFVTPALNQGLLGQPLDLAAINIARGRDLGIPDLNTMREGLGLTAYTSWSEFGNNMQHPESLVNFIAAYSFDGDTGKAAEILGLADGTIVDGAGANGWTADQALAFLNNTNDVVPPIPGAGGVDLIDSWIGGLAEAHVPGSLLGETFDTVFVSTILGLMDGDRFYYLYRLAGTQIHEEVNNGQFKDIVERNTGLEHLNGSIFAYADQYYDLSKARETPLDPLGSFKTEHRYFDLIDANKLVANGTDLSGDANTGYGMWSDAGAAVTSMNSNGGIITLNGTKYIRDFRPELDANQVHTVEGTPTSGANSHEVLVGSDYRDYLQMRGGDDTVYGEGGDDYLFGGGGVDRLFGGDGDDIIDTGEGPDLADGGAGDDTIYGYGSGSEVGGFDQLVGGEGNDKIYGGEGIDKLSGGAGDDMIWGDGPNPASPYNTDPFTHGGDGNDYIDGGGSGDNLYGDAGDDLVIGGADQDIVSGGDGDDILRPGNPSQAINGGPDEVLGGDGFTDTGFDLIDFSDYVPSSSGVIADMVTQQNPLTAIDGTTPFPAWFQIEGIIGSRNNDTFVGSDAIAPVATTTQIDGSNWLFGGAGDDSFEGNGGNDILVGGSLRLDSLIGSYVDTYTHYIDGASHRTDGAMRNNDIIDVVNGVLGVQAFDKHYTEFLKTDLFKDYVLGDGLTDGTLDRAVFTGGRADYTISYVDVATQGNGTVRTYIVEDTVGGRDGTDIVTGIETFSFNGIDVSEGTLGALAVAAPNLAPVITSNRGEAGVLLTQPENQLAVTTVTAIDTDGGPNALSYSIVGGADALLFNIVGGTGVLTFIAPPSFENGDGIFEVVVRASDGAAFDEQKITVKTANIDEAATGGVHIASYTRTATSATLNAGGDLADGDVAGPLAVTYTWTVGATVSTGPSLTLTAGAAVQTAHITSATYTDVFGLHTVAGAPETAIIGTTANNNINGTGGNDFIFGFGGAIDVLHGGAGSDVLDGGAGADYLYGDAGADTLIGGAGDDRYYNIDATDTIVEISGGGNDLVISNAINVDLSQASMLEIEYATLQGSLALSVIGNNKDNYLYGYDNTAANQLTGGLGNDRFYVGAGDTVVEVNGQGTDLIVSRDINIDLNNFANCENASLVDGAALNMIGTAAVNVMNGNSNANRIEGRGGNDTLNGFAGNDTFVYAAGYGNDRIVGFDADAVGGQDVLDVSALGINIGNFATSVHWSLSGADTLITIDGFAGQSIRLLGITPAVIDHTDFGI